MFRLNDAVRRYQAQHRSQTELRGVAATVTILSPCDKPETAQVVASVAAVVAPPFESADLALLIKQLQEEGAVLQHRENALLVRPSHWQQLDSVSPHWEALLRFLQANEHGEENGAGRMA